MVGPLIASAMPGIRYALLVNYQYVAQVRPGMLSSGRSLGRGQG
jgi:hypothetical protein